MSSGSIAAVVPKRLASPGVAAAIIALGAASFMSLGSQDFCLDDAWIHLAYAKSLQLGDGFSYNPGDRATGFSSPLWAALISLTPFAAHPVLVVKLLGALCHAALAWASARAALLFSPAEHQVRNATAAGILVALDPLLVFSAGSGMEVSLTAALLGWTVVAMEVELAALSGAVLGALCVWARPECLLLLAPYCALRWAETRRLRMLVPLAGALCGLGAWVVYSELVSGYPWPNTYYAKRHANLLRSLSYFALRVLPQQAWAIALTGVVLVIAAFTRAGPVRALALAWAAAVIAIAATREIITGALFYSSRYFAIFGAIPCVIAASRLPARGAFALIAVLPILIVSFFVLPNARGLQREQEADITAQHIEPSLYLARELPKDARLAVEGAGATRFFLPRSVRIIDVVGLNYLPAVHATTTTERLCSVLRARPTHLLLPDGFIQFFEQALVLEPMRTFVDEHTAITTRSSVRRIHAARILDVRPEARQACGLPGSPGHS